MEIGGLIDWSNGAVSQDASSTAQRCDALVAWIVLGTRADMAFSVLGPNRDCASLKHSLWRMPLGGRDERLFPSLLLFFNQDTNYESEVSSVHITFSCLY